MPFPSDLLFPSDTLFPSDPAVPVAAGGLEVEINGLPANGVDPFGVQWTTFVPLVGWDGSPASSVELTKKPYVHGAWPGPASATPRVVAFSGIAEAQDNAALTDAMDRLNAAVTFGDFILTVTRAGVTRSAIARRQDEVLWTDEDATIAQWSAQMVCPDPRKFATALTSSTGLPSSTGGLTVPIVVPIVISETVTSGSVSLTNPGNATGPVVIRIDGPVVGPVITHVGSGLSVVFSSSLSLRSGEWLIIDMEARSALAQGQASRNGSIESRGWGGFEPGGNTWRMDSTSYNPAARFTVTATPAWL